MGDHSSVSQRLHISLSDVINSCPDGERLPSEPKLAQQLGVSRATLREAMRYFETQGLIYRRQGAGTYKLPSSPVMASGLEVLESIETLAKRIGLQAKMGEVRIEQRPATEEESIALGLEGISTVVVVKRIIQANGKSSAYLIDILPDDVLYPIELADDFSGSVLDFLLKRGKFKLVSSRCEINAVDASAEIAKALGIQRGDALLRFVAWLFTTSGRVIDYSYSYFLPGYFRFHVLRRVGRSDINKINF